MNGSRAVEQVSANGSVDPLRTFRDHLKWQQERYKPFALRDYIEGMLDGKYPKPVRNAAQLLVDALTVQAPRLHPAGFKEYPVFSDRDDELAVKGIPRRIDVLMRYLHAEARLNAKDRALLLVGTSGAGKSTINGVLIDALERYTDQAEPAPVYGIVDCPINEEPLHVLDERTRAIWKEKHEVDITGHLCPECRSRAEQQVQRIEMAQVMHSGANIPLDFKVQALPFSQALGRGITRLAPNVTKFMVPNAPESINTAIMGSNRGILYMPEMGQPSQEFLKTLNDLMRGRRYDAKGRFYQLDCVIIADTTLDEWARFFKDSTNQGLIERFEVITIPFPLDPDAELSIFEKRLTASRLVNPPHFPPRSLQFLSSWSVRTRYRRPNDGIKIDEATKAKLYSGVNVGNFTQLDRKKIETEGEKAGEGIEGISPPAAWNIIFKLTGERMVWLEGDEERSCVDFVDLRRRAEEYIEDAPFNERIKSQMKEQLEVVTSEHDTWLQRTIEQAFQDRYAERAEQMIQNYLDELEYWLDPTKPRRIDEATGNPIEVSLEALGQFEQAVTRIGQSGLDGFRRDVFQWAGKVNRKKNRNPQPADFEDRFPGFEQGLKVLLTNGLGEPKDMLMARTPTSEQIEKLKEMQGRLISEYGFCAHCMPKLVTYISNKLRQGKS